MISREAGKLIFSSTRESGLSSLEVLDLATRSVNTIRDQVESQIRPLTISEDETLVGVGLYDGSVLIWDIDTGQTVRRLGKHEGTVSAVAFSHDGELLASMSGSGTTRIWDVGTGGRLANITAGTTLGRLAFSPDGTTLLVSDADMSIKLWDLVHQDFRIDLTGHLRQPCALAFSADGRTFASGDFDGVVRIWSGASEAVSAGEPSDD